MCNSGMTRTATRVVSEALRLVTALAHRDERQASIQALAEFLHADSLIIFIADPDLNLLLPAPGFPQTLPDARTWRHFLDTCAVNGRAETTVIERQSGQPCTVCGIALEDGSVVALIGGEPDEMRTAEACLYMPLLAAVLREERASRAAAGHAQVAHENALQLKALASALDSTRGALQKALRSAAEANQQLEYELGERRRAETALKRLNETLEERVHERTEQVRALASALTLAEHRERGRIARLLHDHLQQLLYGIQMRLHILKNSTDEQREALFSQSESTLREAIKITRTLTVDLSPPILHGEGLDRALHWLASQMKESYHLNVVVTTEGTLSTPSEEMRILLFHLVRELLFNVVKHAKVQEAYVGLRETKQNLIIVVQDNGVGFDLDGLQPSPDLQQGMGLFSIQERLRLFDGNLQVESSPGHGTRMTIRAPLTMTMSHPLVEIKSP